MKVKLLSLITFILLVSCNKPQEVKVEKDESFNFPETSKVESNEIEFEDVKVVNKYEIIRADKTRWVCDGFDFTKYTFLQKDEKCKILIPIDHINKACKPLPMV